MLRFRSVRRFPEASAKATADQINKLFHCPKKSDVDCNGKKTASGITYAIAVNKLSLLARLYEKQVTRIDPNMKHPAIKPISPVSPANWI